jgi:cation diffusion facilitator family transporter
VTKKEKVALISVFASTVLTLSKAIIGLLTGSLGILSEAGHSFLDLLATLMTYFAVRISDKPADEEHHFGHAKVESVTALIETGLLFVLSFLVLWKAGSYILFGSQHEVTLSVWAFAVILMSIAIDFSRARALTKVAQETSSHALEADALHYSSDMWSSMAVFAGLVGVAFGYPMADTIAAIAVAAFICIAGWRLGKRTIDTLVDRAPEGAVEHIREAIGRVKGVIAIDFIRVRPAGDALFVETEVAVNRTLPLDRVANIRERVSTAVVGVSRKRMSWSRRRRARSTMNR